MMDEGIKFGPTNSAKLRDGKLDDELQIFKAEPIDDKSGLVAFQFETGGMTISFKRGMTMTEFADKLEGAAERIRRYQRDGWPMIQHQGH